MFRIWICRKKKQVNLRASVYRPYFKPGKEEAFKMIVIALYRGIRNSMKYHCMSFVQAVMEHM